MTVENLPCRLVVAGHTGGYLNVVCNTCNETCALQLRRQRRSTTGEGQNLFEIVCPKCGALRPMLASSP